MSFMHRVMLHGAALALPALLSVQAFAQTAQPKEPDGTTGSAVREEPSLPQAPIGHRQPRAADLPATRERDPSDVWLNQLNRDLPPQAVDLPRLLTRHGRPRAQRRAMRETKRCRAADKPRGKALIARSGPSKQE